MNKKFSKVLVTLVLVVAMVCALGTTAFAKSFPTLPEPDGIYSVQCVEAAKSVIGIEYTNDVFNENPENGLSASGFLMYCVNHTSGGLYFFRTNVLGWTVVNTIPKFTDVTQLKAGDMVIYNDYTAGIYDGVDQFIYTRVETGKVISVDFDPNAFDGILCIRRPFYVDWSVDL